MATYLMIMALVIMIIALAAIIGLICKTVFAFKDGRTTWCKCASILNIIAVATVGSALVTLFYQVATMIA